MGKKRGIEHVVRMSGDVGDIREVMARQNRPVANTPQRNIRIHDDLWKKAARKAERRHETVTAVIVRALVEYTEGEPELEEDEK